MVTKVAVVGTGDEPASVWEAGSFTDEGRDFSATFNRHMDALLPALAPGDQPPVHAAAGRRALELALASIESSETGRCIATQIDAGGL